MKHSPLRRIWNVARWPLGAIAIIFVGLLIYRLPHAAEVAQTEEVVAQIHAQKLTLDDVLGKNLPPPPDATTASSTIAGLDVNGNGIRDDVEWAIFNKYPNSAKIRAAELQYAMALQNELTSVFNSDTLVATIQEEGRGTQCLAHLIPGEASLSTGLSTVQGYEKEIEELVFNTSEREMQHKDIFTKYMTTFSELQNTSCDIDLENLSD